MPLNLPLSPDGRQAMLDELGEDVIERRVYQSPRLTELGQAEFPRLLEAAAREHNDGWLADQLRMTGRLNEHEVSHRNGREYLKAVPYNAAETLAEGELCPIALSCVAADTGSTRLRQWREFFLTYPGTHQDCDRGYCKWYQNSGVGRGGGMLGFLEYLIGSGRIAKSRWWNRTDKAIVQASLTAWNNHARGTGISSYDNSGAYDWLRYITAGPQMGEKDVGGSWRQAWTAHQASLWSGVINNRGAVIQERFEERIFMWKVLNNVETYFRTGIDLDGALGVGIRLGSYPSTYPATASQACGAVLGTEAYAWYVRLFYPPPTDWKDYCREHGGLRPIFVL